MSSAAAKSLTRSGDLRAAGVAEESILRIQNLVMATCHHTLPDTPDARVLVDIDLAILGATPERFEQSSHHREFDSGLRPYI
jgi:predicted metal-dependent HD superfamily phosphohydrolase